MRFNLIKTLLLILCIGIMTTVIACNERVGNDSGKEELNSDQAESVEKVESFDSNNENDSVSSSEVIDVEFKTLTVEMKTVCGVVSNETKEFDFKKELTVIGANYIIAVDPYGIESISTKIVPLGIGDNLVYVLISVNDEIVDSYIVTIRRKPIYTVTFNLSNEEVFDIQYVEEGSIIKEPIINIEKLGYKYDGWDYDFSLPITEDSLITAKWTISEEMSNFIFNSTESTCEIIKVIDKTVTEIIIPNYVTSIGKNAFNYCERITSLEIPNSVTSIGEWAFDGCSSLDVIKIPDSVTYIGVCAFRGCYINEVYITDIEAWCNINFNDQSNPIYYKTKLYLDNELVTDLIIPNSVISIGERAFYEYSELTSVAIGDNVESIGIMSFYGCNNLERVIFGENVSRIEPNAFSHCSKLNNVEIPNNVTFIGGGAFSWCSSLTDIKLSNSITSIESGLFRNCTSLEIVEIPTSVTSIGRDSFGFCVSLIEAIIPDGVACIEITAFSYCENLRSIVIPESVINIDLQAFYCCDNLNTVYYKGLESNWDKISIGEGNSPLSIVKVYYYIENEKDLPMDGGNYWHYDENGNAIAW